MRTEQVSRTAHATIGRRDVLAGATGAILAAPLVGRARAASGPMTFWQPHAPGGPVPTQAAWFEATVQRWNKENPEQIDLVYVPNSEYMNGSKLQTAFASGEGPDLFIISPGDFLRYYNGGILQDLSPFIDAQAQADFPANVIATRRVGGKFYGVPMEVEPMAMYYSVAAFEKAGLNEHDVPQSWDALLELGRKLTSARQYGLLFETTPGYYQNYTWYPFLWQGRGDIQANNKSVFNSPATVQALRFWQDAIKSGSAPRKPLGGGGWDIVPNLASGYCAIQNCGIWGIAALRGGAKDFRYGVFRLPVPTGGHYMTIGGGWAFVANARGRNPEAAAKFCAWALASSKPDSVQRVIDWCTVAKSDMPPRNSAFVQGARAFDTGFLKLFKDSIYPNARGEPRVPPPIYQAISQAIQACQLNGEDPAKQADLASQQIDGFLGTYSGAPIL
ncbi:ABC transporter substrate-binding protein [Lichenicoccus sp.]|uniref:ABC transporter substrate-binding protein n=1 Tax=Lichenicoccus sp. TaxID=2781899 RepID=UPI003D0BABBD